MKTTKFFPIVLLALSAAFLLTSCDEAAKIQIEMPDVSLDIPVEPTGVVDPKSSFKMQTQKTEGERISFSGKYSLNLNDPMFADIKEYVDGNNDITFLLKGAKLLAKDTDYTIYNFTSIAKDGDGNEIGSFGPIASIDINTDYEKALTAYLNKILKAVQSNKTIDIEVSGAIDDPGLSQAEIFIISYMLNLVAEVDIKKTVAL